MKRHITLIITLFVMHTIQSMENVNNTNSYQHRIISKHAAQLIDGNINANTISKWQDVLKEAQDFQRVNPKFPYRLLARRSSQGPDAKSIAEAAPVIIDFLQHKPIEPDKLRRVRYTVGGQYIAKMVNLDVSTLAKWNNLLKKEAESNSRFPYPRDPNTKRTKVNPLPLDFLEEKSIETDKNKLRKLRDILGDRHTLQVIEYTN